MATREGGLAVAVDDTVRFAMPVAAPMQSIRWEVTSYHSEPPKRLHVEWAGRRVLYIEWHEAIEMLTQKKEGVAVAGQIEVSLSVEDAKRFVELHGMGVVTEGGYDQFMPVYEAIRTALIEHHPDPEMGDY